ncbi:MAG: hypothetical protein Q7V19_07215 [Bacteroidales bacterium]|nr:hypothetical protein [Bacteroidales bacterium]MDP2235915.1 hypothetical protein [Bacteroidales bacterium]
MITQKNFVSLLFLIVFLTGTLPAQNQSDRLKLAMAIESAETIFYEGASGRNASCHITYAGQITETDSTYNYSLTYNIKEIDLDLTEIVELTDPDSVALLLKCKRNERCIQYKPFDKKERSHPSFEVFVKDGTDKTSLETLLFHLKEIQLILAEKM